MGDDAPASRSVFAVAVALGAGVVAGILGQCDTVMDDRFWGFGHLLMLAGAVIGTLLVPRYWYLWVGLAAAPAWLAIVICYAHHDRDPLTVLYFPLEAFLTAGIAFITILIKVRANRVTS
jgi:hypothetical protein